MWRAGRFAEVLKDELVVSGGGALVVQYEVPAVPVCLHDLPKSSTLLRDSQSDRLGYKEMKASVAEFCYTSKWKYITSKKKPLTYIKHVHYRKEDVCVC